MTRASVLWLAALALVPGVAETGEVKWPDCYCTDRDGSRVELGELRCLHVDGRTFTARCEMSLNNPMWREVSEGCMSVEAGGANAPG